MTGALRKAIGVFLLVFCVGKSQVHTLLITGRLPLNHPKRWGYWTKTPQTWGTTREIGRRDAHSELADSDSSAAAKKSHGFAAVKLRWIACPSTNDLEDAVRRWICPSDAVAELGAQLRSVSQAIVESLDASQGGTAVLVDVARKLPSAANSLPHRTRAMRQQAGAEVRLPPHAAFVELDRLEEWRRALLDHAPASHDGCYDVLVLDINSIAGNDLEWTSLALVQEFNALFPQCSTVLVKSVRLNQFASRLVHFQRWRDAHASGDGEEESGASPPVPSLSLSPPPHIVATVGVHEYRQTIPLAVRPGDAVLEVGCHLGTTAQLLHRRAASLGGLTPSSTERGFCVGVDLGAKIVAHARARHPDVTFAIGDAWKTGELLRLRSLSSPQPSLFSQGWNVVYVDVGGLSGRDGMLEAIMLVSSLANALEPRCIVAKSLCLQRLASVLHPYWRVKGSPEAGSRM